MSGWLVIPVVILVSAESSVALAASAPPLSTCHGLIARAAVPAVVGTPTPVASEAPATAAAVPIAAATARAGGDTNPAALNAVAGPEAVNEQAQSSPGPVELNYPFGSSRDPILHRETFRVPADMKLDDVAVTVPFGEMAEVGSGRPLPPGHVLAAVNAPGPGRLVAVSICVNPVHPREMPAGTYVGTALIGVDDRQTPVTLRVTVQDDERGLVILAALLGLVVGLWVKLFADSHTENLPSSKWENLRSPRSWFAIGAGLVAAFYSYRTIYADDPTFAASLDNLWRLTAETFAGTLAAKGLADLAGPLTGGGKAGGKGGGGGHEKPEGEPARPVVAAPPASS